MLAGGVSAQLVDKVLSVLGEDSVGNVTVARTDSDSVKLALQKQRIDSLRAVTPGIPVVVEKEPYSICMPSVEGIRPNSGPRM